MKTMVSTAGTGAPGPFDGADVLGPGAKAGPWTIERELGRGGMGAVYAVVHSEIGKRAALKTVHPHLVASFNTDRMLLEAKVVNQVGHPSIVDIFETGRLNDGRPYIVMERLDGQSLAVRADDSKLGPELVIAILLQVCDALIAAHAAGIVHRDLKLDNVFLIDNPEEPATPRVKLLDWGIAKVIHSDVRTTIDGQLMGTPQYLSPEQARGQAVSPETDVYSLGVMAYELFLDRLPFQAETAAEVIAMHLRATPPPPRELWPDVPGELHDLLLAMLAKQPDRRPSMLEVARRLQAIGDLLAHGPLSQAAPPPAAAPALAPPAAPPGIRSPAARSPGRRGFRSQARWQYAIGGLAIAVSVLMLWVSRVGDRAPSAAFASGAIIGSPPREAPGRTGSAPDLAPSDAANTAGGAGLQPAVLQPAVLDVSAELAERSAPQPRAIALHPARPGRSRGAALRAASRAATTAGAEPAHPSPAAPRRGTKVDPDGTLDAY